MIHTTQPAQADRHTVGSQCHQKANAQPHRLRLLRSQHQRVTCSAAVLLAHASPGQIFPVWAHWAGGVKHHNGPRWPWQGCAAKRLEQAGKRSWRRAAATHQKVALNMHSFLGHVLQQVHAGKHRGCQPGSCKQAWQCACWRFACAGGGRDRTRLFRFWCCTALHSGESTSCTAPRTSMHSAAVLLQERM